MVVKKGELMIVWPIPVRFAPLSPEGRGDLSAWEASRTLPLSAIKKGRKRPNGRVKLGAVGSAAAGIHKTQYLHLAADAEVMALGFARKAGVDGVEQRCVAFRVAAQQGA